MHASVLRLFRMVLRPDQVRPDQHLEAMALSLEKFGVEFPRALLIDFVGRSDESFFQFVYENFDKRFSPEEMQEEKM